MGKITNGKKIPDFKADATNDSTFDLKSNEKNLVIYFYPKDNTPGCTTEGENFRDLYKKFKAEGTNNKSIRRKAFTRKNR